jgi:tetratricopeptide (TPR) repeat protein
MQTSKPGRNEPCPCGSGRKYKKCCGQAELAATLKAAEPLPSDAEGHYNFGLALLDAGRPEDAIAYFRHSLTLKPDLLQAHIGLAQALVEMGRPTEALHSYHTALELNPRLAEVHNILGNVLVGLGQLEEAEACYRRALSLLPQRAELHSNLSRVLLDMARVDESIASSHRALEIDPDLPEAHENLAGALLNVNFEQAVAHYRQALRFRPDDADLNYRLGVALRLLGRTSEAEACCRRALELSPDHAAAIATLAEARADRGDFAAAEALFKQALALNGDLSDVWVGLSRLHRFTRDDTPWLQQAERVAGQSRQPREVIALRYAIAKYFDDIGEYQQAFGNYRHANELSKRHSRPYDREQVTRQIDGLIARYPRVVPVGGATVTTRAVLIVGMPRSGTSLAEQILASHPSVFGAGELNFWHSASLALRAAGPDAEERIGQFGADYERLLAQMSNGAPRVVDKMPTNFLELGLVLSALPGTKVIHMQRDPVDTCLSIYFQDFRATIAYANDLDDLVHFYRAYTRLMQRWRQALPAGALLDVPYESLVDDQEAWTRRMLEFVDLPWDPACLDFHQTQRSVVTASKWQVRQKINRSSVARWRHYQDYIAPLLALSRPAETPADAASG